MDPILNYIINTDCLFNKGTLLYQHEVFRLHVHMSDLAKWANFHLWSRGRLRKGQKKHMTTHMKLDISLNKDRLVNIKTDWQINNTLYALKNITSTTIYVTPKKKAPVHETYRTIVVECSSVLMVVCFKACDAWTEKADWIRHYSYPLPAALCIWLQLKVGEMEPIQERLPGRVWYLNI